MRHPLREAAVPRAALALLGLGLAAATGCAGPCSEERLSETPSPDGRLRAVVYRANCGATTDYATHVAILPAGPRGGGAPGPGDDLLVVRFDGPVGVTWTGPRVVRVRRPPGYDGIHHARPMVRGVRVVFDPPIPGLGDPGA